MYNWLMAIHACEQNCSSRRARLPSHVTDKGQQNTEWHAGGSSFDTCTILAGPRRAPAVHPPVLIALALLFRNFTSSSPANGEVSGPGDSLHGDIDRFRLCWALSRGPSIEQVHWKGSTASLSGRYTAHGATNLRTFARRRFIASPPTGTLIGRG